MIAAAFFWSTITGYTMAPYSTAQGPGAAREHRRFFSFGVDRMIDSFRLYGGGTP